MQPSKVPRAEETCYNHGAFLIAQLVKRLPAVRETWVQFLGWEDPLEKGMALQYSCLGQRSLADYSPWGRKSRT